jgi:uncharacterized protein (TIGR02466 family)
MPVRAWFPTLVYEAPLGGGSLVRRLLEEAARVRKADADGRAWSARHYPGGFTSYASLNRLHRNFTTFMELEQRLDRHVAAFARRLDWDLGRGRLAMSDCWVNVMPRGAAHGLHLHPLSVVSGTLYLKTPPGSPGLRIEDPRLDRQMAAPPRRKDRPHVVLPVKAGRVLLFESWLRHEVPPMLAAGERVSVSFNYQWTGEAR